jgi:hypothetical protein
MYLQEHGGVLCVPTGTPEKKAVKYNKALAYLGRRYNEEVRQKLCVRWAPLVVWSLMCLVLGIYFSWSSNTI